MKTIKTIMISIALFALPNVGSAQSLEYAKQLYKEEKYLEAAKVLRPLADGGNAEAQAYAAHMFFLGKGVQANNQQGLKYAKLSADQGCEDGVDELLYYYAGIKKDESLAYQTLHKYLYDFQLWGGRLPAVYGNCLLKGIGTPVERIRGWQVLEVAADNKGSQHAYKYLLQNASDYLQFKVEESGVTDIVQYVKTRNFVSDVILDCIIRDYEAKHPNPVLDSNVWFKSKDNRYAKYILAQLFYNFWERREYKMANNVSTGITVAEKYAKEALNAGVEKARALATELSSAFHVGEVVTVNGIDGKIFLAEGKDGCAASKETRLCNRQEADAWTRQTRCYLANNEAIMKELVKQLAKSGDDVSGGYWINNGVCEFDAKGNYKGFYYQREVPAHLGTKYKTYLIMNVKK